VFRHRWKAPDGTWHRTKTWYIRYRVPGHGKVTESTGSIKEADAWALLEQRVGQRASGKLVHPRADKTTLEQITALVLTFYATNARRSVERIKAAYRHLYAYWSPETRASALATADVEGYKAHRLAQGAQPGTVNRELGALRRAYRLGLEQDLAARVPTIKLLQENHAREGFFEVAEFEAVVAELAPDLQDLTRFAYWTGWRRGEVLHLLWSDVDREARVIRLRRETTKTGQPRLLALDGDLWALIERRWAARTVTLPSGEVRLADHVFHRQGRRIRDFHRAWVGACRRARVPGKLFHDLRRTAIRNLTRAWVPDTVAMRISGHKTRSVFDRYNITSEADLREAVRKVEAYAAAHPAGARTVVPLAAEATPRRRRGSHA
jgi:integrase